MEEDRKKKEGWKGGWMESKGEGRKDGTMEGLYRPPSQHVSDATQNDPFDTQTTFKPLVIYN
jgi:hypothetical protein